MQVDLYQQELSQLDKEELLAEIRELRDLCLYVDKERNKAERASSGQLLAANNVARLNMDEDIVRDCRSKICAGDDRLVGNHNQQPRDRRGQHRPGGASRVIITVSLVSEEQQRRQKLLQLVLLFRLKHYGQGEAGGRGEEVDDVGVDVH